MASNKIIIFFILFQKVAAVVLIPSSVKYIFKNTNYNKTQIIVTYIRWQKEEK